MSYSSATPFDSIENTQEYFRLLREMLAEVNGDIGEEIAVATQSNSTRRVDALQLVLYKTQKLEEHVKAGSRLLKDLRTLRRLLLNDQVPNDAEFEQATLEDVSYGRRPAAR
ncbi:MAG: hypothetical protein WA581_02975 [Candidatus Acidiferrales bacterium]